MKTSFLAFGMAGLGVAALVVACGGASSTDVLGDPQQATTSTSGVSSSGGTSGTSGASGTSGTSGTSGASSTSSSGGTTTSSSGTPCKDCNAPPNGCTFTDKCSCTYECRDAGGPVKCTWNANFEQCPSNYYCDAPSCGDGVCVRKGEVETAQREPQCGCNGVTFWNGSVARKAGMAVRSGGECNDTTAAKCGGFGPASCPNGGVCNMQVKNKAACGNADEQFKCWGMPEKCPNIVVGGEARSCGVAVTCQSECQAIRKGGAWYEDGSCPQ